MNGAITVDGAITTTEFAQHIITALADYAPLRVAKHTDFRVNKSERVSHAAVLVELDGGQMFVLEVMPA